MQRHFVLGLFLAVSLTMAACGDDGATTPQQDAGQQDGPQLDAVASEGGAHDAGPDGPRQGSSFDTAIPMTVNDQNGKSGSISPAGTVNYYKFEGTAGDWMFLYTDANPDDDPEMVDTVIQLFDSNQTMIAENDDSVPRVNTDSELMVRLPSTGTYYVTVQEFSTWAGDPDEGGPTFIYKLYAVKPDAGVAGVVMETEPNDTVDTATQMTYLSGATAVSKGAFILGSFASGTDTDVYKFNVPAIPDGGVGTFWNVEFQIMPAGPTGYGATNPVGEAYITDATGATTIAKIDNSLANGPFELQPPLPAGDYLLFLKHPAAAAGTNDFYAIKHNMYAQDNPVEAEGTATGVNDTLATAEALTVEPVGAGSTAKAAFILATLPTGDAADYFKINVANATDQISLVCGAARNGSGLTGLNVTVRKADDTVVTGGDKTEILTEDLRINDLPVPAAGDYWIKLTPGGQAAGVTGSYVRCGFYVAPPPAP